MRPALALSAALAATLLASAAAAQPAPDRAWTVEGRLDDEDPRDEEERRYDEHPLILEAGRRYRISADSDDFDTVIRLYRAGDSEPVAENDDFEGLNSRLTYVPTESGGHVLRVFAFSSESGGAYSAQARLLPPLPAPSREPPTDSATMHWDIWEGELAETDADRDGTFFDDYLIAMRAGETRYLALESGDFDPLLWVMNPDDREGGPIHMDDDSGGDLNALTAFRAEKDGDYVVRATSFGSGRTGAYRLRISDPVIPPPPVRPKWPDEPSDD